ncbi:MAG: hypothetical protein LCH32_00190 [Bacteroidetes bacterium]|nr:hypothetical protein [Bacteroidota bacterium]
MIKFLNTYLFLILLLLFNYSNAQQTTINKKNNDAIDRNSIDKNKVMLIPFEPKLYMSEIDYKICSETKLSTKEVKHQFRDGINEQIGLAFKSEKISSVDLMSDSAKFKKELYSIYSNLSYEYQKVPNQENYQPPKKEKDKKEINKGQIVVETNTDERFMNAKVTNAKLIPLLGAKYKCNYFIFINQLDIKASGNSRPGQISTGVENRKIIVHYTVFSLDAKEINSGIAEEEFSTTLNNPKKIIDKHFSKVAQLISTRTIKALAVPK